MMTGPFVFFGNSYMPYRCLWHGSLFPSGVLRGVPERLHALEMPVGGVGVPETSSDPRRQG